MSTYSNTAREVEMPNGDVVVLHSAPTGGANTTSNIKKFKYDDNGHVTESEAANATDLNLNSYSTPTTGSTAIGTSDAVQTAIGKLDHQSQIDQSNILYALETGAANYAPLEGDNRSGSGYFLDATNSGMKVFTSGTVMHVYCEYTKTTNTQFSIQFTNASGNVIASTSLYAPSASASGTISGDVTLSQDVYGYNAYYNGASGNTCAITNVMICPKNVWDAIQKYIPYSLPNYDLTRLEAEDRAGLVECVDGGAKNKLQNKATSKTENNVTFTVNSDGEVTVSTTAQGASANTSVSLTGAYIPNTFVGNILSGVPSGSTGDKCLLIAYSNNGSSEVKAYYINAATYPMHEIQNYPYFQLFVWFKSGQIQTTPLKYQPMICTKAAFGVSQKFVPYRPPYDQMIPLIMHGEVATTTTETMYSDFSVTIPPRSAVRITAYLNWYNTVPRSITISKSTDSSNYTKPDQVVARTELPAEGNYSFVQTSAIYVTGNSSITLSIWARSKASGNNNLTVITEFLGSHE